MSKTRQKSKVFEITKFGQKVWLDDLLTDLIDSGEFAKLMEDDGLTGVTTNPSIFEKAIRTNPKYADRIKKLGENGADVLDIYDDLIIEEVQKVADVLRPVYDETGGLDGFVSIEVDPELAHNANDTIQAALDLHLKVDRPNILIKVPGTKEGEKAIRHLIGKGISVNVTLLFSVDQYIRTVQAYLKGIDEYVEHGGDPSSVYSVASVFVSRIDTLVDKLLEQIIARSTEEEIIVKARSLMGKAAVANSRLVYQQFERSFLKKEFEPYRLKKTRFQDIVWGSTSVKNPDYRDVMYVEEIIGPHTINTMPFDTMKAFRDHGVAARTIDIDYADAKRVIHDLGELGISIGNVCEKLQNEGVEAFTKAFTDLMAGIKDKLLTVEEDSITSVFEL